MCLWITHLKRIVVTQESHSKPVEINRKLMTQLES